ncbi:urate hydroxylase PuuD [Halioxenophilus sp. WMMB6]|uniref:urate hydroxylase PuuD n=1 Tax=Halioxenophilus sp. WMMB6 TaxID=3073815 RepID=UPI00295E4E3B|nr:urate hydroxylase PuuD [Halioxenophilus sp. WMMB6]
MVAYILDWLSLAVRWLHLLAAIAWIGSSLKYVWIDNNLRKPPQWKADKGIKGDVWVIHGGGIYEFQKYNVAPEKMPDVLHWVKWESYTTWLSGFLLISVVYYSQASSYLMVSDGIISSPWMAVAAGLGFLASIVGLYEILIRTPLVKSGPLFACAMALLLLVASYIAFHLFAPRAAALHMGAAIGSIMSGNVFFGIVPAQKAFLKAIENGQPPPQARAEFAKLRSTHNNYFTLPVIMLMISNHYPVVYSHAWGWLLVVAIGVISAYARHYFNLRNQGKSKPHILVVVAIAAVLLITLARVTSSTVALSDAANTVTDEQMMAVVSSHCSSCHAVVPTQPGFVAPPAGIVLANAEQVRAVSDRIMTVAVQSQYMPLGNMTGMTLEERQTLGAWLQRQ